MIRKMLAAALSLFIILVAIVLTRTFLSRPWPVYHPTIALSPLPDSAIAHMSEAIQIPTISTGDTLLTDTVSFNRFGEFLNRAYPLMSHLLKARIESFSLVYEWPGTDSALAPFVLMSHYDVVPVEQASLSSWTVPPFSGKITDSCIWGRGAVDDKLGVIAICEAVEEKLRKGFKPPRTIFICFGHNEEQKGSGARATVEYLDSLGVRPELVLDEGGQLTIEKARELHRPLAVIGAGEKGYASFELKVEKTGGHSSTPEDETAIDILSRAVAKVRSAQPAYKITPQLREFLGRVGSSSSKFQNRMAAANMWLFGKMAANIVAQEPEGKAMMHTTIVPTIIQSGVKENVIPSVATAIVNSRILTGETARDVKHYLTETIRDDRVKIREIGTDNSDPSPATSTKNPAFKRIENAIYETVPAVIPAPYQMVGATDSRFYRKISSGVVNFFPMMDAKGYHGINERVMLIDLHRSIHFVKTILEESGKKF